MDFITRQRFLTFAIIILVLLNLFSLGAIWILQSKRKPLLPPFQGLDRRGREGNVVEFLHRELNLTEEQVKGLKVLRQKFDQERRFLENEILETRRELVEESFRPDPDSVKAEKLASKIGENQILLERLLFDHFVKMKSLCTSEQSEKFDSLIHEILHRNRPPDVPPPPRDGRQPRDGNRLPPHRNNNRPRPEINPSHEAHS